MMESQTPQSLLWNRTAWFVAFCMSLAIGVIGFVLLRQGHAPMTLPPRPTNIPSSVDVITSMPTLVQPDLESGGFEIYRNDDYGFSLKYPVFLRPNPLSIAFTSDERPICLELCNQCYVPVFGISFSIRDGDDMPISPIDIEFLQAESTRNRDGSLPEAVRTTEGHGAGTDVLPPERTDATDAILLSGFKTGDEDSTRCSYAVGPFDGSFTNSRIFGSIFNKQVGDLKSVSRTRYGYVVGRLHDPAHAHTTHDYERVFLDMVGSIETF